MNDIKLHYFNPAGIRNFGDQLSPLIIKELFNVNANYANVRNADMIAIGSVIQEFLVSKPNIIKELKLLLKPKLHIWGSGIISPEHKNLSFRKKVVVHALRGKLTKSIVENILGKNLDSITLGDPGLLASSLMTEMPKKQYKLGIIPHYVDVNNPILHKLISVNSRCNVIDVSIDPVRFLNEVARCDVIISSAMHGLIAADSLGIPNMRFKVSSDITGGDYKFLDYYSSFNINELPDFLDFTRLQPFMINTSSIIENYVIRQDDVAKVQAELVKCFPFCNSPNPPNSLS